MATYEELHDMIMEESVTNKIGKAGLAINQKIKDKINKEKDVDDFNKIEGISKARHTAANLPVGTKAANNTMSTAEDLKEKHDNYIKSDSKGAKVLKKTEDTTVKVAKATGKAIGAGIDKTSGAVARAIKAGIDEYIIRKYKNNPEKLEKELRENIKKLEKVKEDIATVELIAIGFPMAIATAGALDNVFRGVLLAAAVADENRVLQKAIVSASAWAPYIIAKLNKVRKSLEALKAKKDGKEIDQKTYDNEYVELMEDLKKLVDQALAKCDEWAKSDEPLYEKVTKYIAKNTRGIKESVDTDLYLCVIESFENGSITEEEYNFLVESLSI